MTLRSFLVGLAGNFIAAGIFAHLSGPKAGLISLCIGFLLLIVAYAIGKKPQAPASLPPRQENKQSIEFNPHFNPQFNPQQNVYIGDVSDSRTTAIEQEQLRNEELIIAFMKRVHPGGYYDRDEIASGVDLNKRDTSNALERLRSKGRVHRTTADQAPDGYLWVLDEKEQ